MKVEILMLIVSKVKFTCPLEDKRVFILVCSEKKNVYVFLESIAIISS